METTNLHPDEDAADALARVYQLILSWPTTAEKQARRRKETMNDEFKQKARRG